MSAANREAFREAANKPLPFESVDVPEIGLVWIQGLSGRGRDAWESSCATIKGRKVIPNMDNTRARLVTLCACNEDRSLMFTPADAEWLGKLPASQLDPMVEKAQQLSGITKADIEELGKASALAAGSDSPTS